MDLVSKDIIHGSQALSSIRSPSKDSIFGGSQSHSDTSFPIIAIAIVGILATGFLLVSYYIFAIKCCLSWHPIDLLRRFSLSRNRRYVEAHSPAMEYRGLNEAVIRSIPIFQYKIGERLFRECAVCLNEFQEGEKLRVIPNCSHIFHIDCIDVWLQSNSNCPLCRTSILSAARFPNDNPIVAPSSMPQDPNPCTENLISSDENFVVIELGNQKRLKSGELLEQRVVHKKARKFLQKVTSMGDEYINTRGKDEQIAIEPIRRSFSVDSSADPKLYLAIQEAVQQKRQVIEGCSSRSKRSFLAFAHGSRASRS